MGVNNMRKVDVYELVPKMKDGKINYDLPHKERYTREFAYSGRLQGWGIDSLEGDSQSFPMTVAIVENPASGRVELVPVELVTLREG